MGPGDPEPYSAHNRLYGNMFRLPVFIGTFGGGLAVVDVRDLVATILAAAERGRSGESYLSVGANVPYKEVLSLMARHAGKKFLPIVIPSFALACAGWLAELLSRLTRRRPLLTLAWAASDGPPYYSNRKSIDELGVSYRPPGPDHMGRLMPITLPPSPTQEKNRLGSILSAVTSARSRTIASRCRPMGKVYQALRLRRSKQTQRC